MNVVISYRSDPACNEATFVIVDATGNVGQHTALVLGSNGLLVIGYYGVTNEDLRLVSYASGIDNLPGDSMIYLPVVIK